MNNPITQRLTRHARPPSPRLAVWLAVGVGLILAALLSWEMLTLRSTAISIGGLLAIAGMLLTLIAPFVTAAFTAAQTARDAQREEFQLVQITGLDRDSIIRGYIAAGLHRVRWLLAVNVALWPAIVIGWIELGIQIAIIFANLVIGPSTYSPTHLNAPPPSAQQGIIETGLLTGGVALVLWFENLVAAVVGVGLGLSLRNPVAGGLAAPFIMVLNAAVWVWLFYLVGVDALRPGLIMALFLGGLMTGGTLWECWRRARRRLEKVGPQ